MMGSAINPLWFASLAAAIGLRDWADCVCVREIVERMKRLGFWVNITHGSTHAQKGKVNKQSGTVGVF